MTDVQRTFTLSDVIKGLVSIVKKFGPEYKAVNDDGNTACTYAVKDEHGYLNPVCIVGQFFAMHGLLGLIAQDMGDYGACFPGNEMFNELKNKFGIVVTPEAQQFLRFAQTRQDDGKTWGHSINFALEATQEYVLEKAKAENIGLFGSWETSPITSLNAPEDGTYDGLADWERDLLNG
jgi:hypothetical protein